jgi:dihydrolipoamide dehydrogenase
MDDIDDLMGERKAMSDKYDIAVLGGGPGGYVAAIRAAQLGARVVCIEKGKLGGVCLNWGCIPTKAMIASASLYSKILNCDKFGLRLRGEIDIDFPAICERRDKIVDGLVKGVGFLFKSHGVELLEGYGILKSPGSIEVRERDGSSCTVEASHIILATGSRPLNIPVFPFDGDGILSSNDMVSMTEIPKSLLIIGAGVIGCEFGFLMSKLGCQVEMVEMMSHALPLEDEDVSKLIERELKKAKIKLHLGKKVASVKRAKSGLMISSVENGPEIETEKVLVCIGRSFNTKEMGLEDVGVELNDNGSIKVDEYMRTSVDRVYAIGDVAGRYLLAYTASAEGCVAVSNCLGNNARMDYTAVPNSIFTSPEVGTVGFREKQAEDMGHEVKVGRFRFIALGKAQAENEPEGEVKIIADADTDKILGVHIVSAHATDLIHEAAVAIRHGLTAGQLGDTIHAHPVMAEAIFEAAHDVHGLSVHTLKPRK